MNQFILLFTLCFSIGAGLFFFAHYLYKRSILSEAQEEANELLKEAQEQFELEEKERQEKSDEIQFELWSKVEDQHLAIEEKCTDLDEKIQSRKKHYEETDKLQRQGLMQTENELRTVNMKLQDHQKTVEDIKNSYLSEKENYKKEILKKTNESEADILQMLKQKFITEAEADFENHIARAENETKDFAEAKAKRILGLCIDRFSKEMSTERNIASTFFPDEKVRALFCARLKENVQVIQDITGCDILIDENPDPERLFNVQVIGYDPVRRELTRRIFDKIFRDTEKSGKQTDPNYIKKVGETLKNELLKQIKKDGDVLAKELGFSDIHPEIKQVMGSLRFRYSYTQNQYFHCGEVGWFAGLLASEIDAPIKDSRRSGLLHDLGKALDHQFDGSHAVIGADFIVARGEKDNIVHAVRAHHYDVQPENEMDFLVIAADAISGGRPGARRSTMETYNQKVSGLQEISKRHHGVTDVFILNGGRECRVHVNSRQVDDQKALNIASLIAKSIEEEMQYPGQIKVVVVRETYVSEARHVEHKKGRH